MPTDFYALISDDSPRASLYVDIFGSLRIPIQSPIPVSAELPGYNEPVKIVEVAINELTDEQKTRLAHYLARQFGYPPDQIRSELAEIGCPIRMDDDVFIAIYNPQKWIG